MNIERKIEDCKACLSQIRRYDPDPYYVKYFFVQFIDTINHIYAGIFEEANRDFGLYVDGTNSEGKFAEMAVIKNDKKAIEFSEWFRQEYEKEHEKPFPDFIKKISRSGIQGHRLPKLKIMLRPKERFKDDVFQEINPRLSDEKLGSVDELKIEISRQMPAYLEIINHKRRQGGQPKVGSDQIVPSAFVNIDGNTDFEISYAVEIYIPVINRMIVESRAKVRELTSWD